jgi:hypothetical protein
VRGCDDDRPLPWFERMTVCREVCSKGPGFHAHLGTATIAVGSFLVAVALGKSGRCIGVIPVLLLITVVAWFTSIRHTDGSSGGG